MLMPQLKKGGSGAGALMEPITKLLKSKENTETWNPALRGSLKSAIAGRQYPQSRVFAAGWAAHNKCIFCLHHLVELGASTARRTRIRGKTKPGEHKKLDKARYKVEATDEQIKEAPIGNLGHRIWRCTAEHMTRLRERWAPPSDLVTTSRCEVDGHPAWERALQPRPTKPMKKLRPTNRSDGLWNRQEASSKAPLTRMGRCWTDLFMSWPGADGLSPSSMMTARSLHRRMGSLLPGLGTLAGQRLGRCGKLVSEPCPARSNS